MSCVLQAEACGAQSSDAAFERAHAHFQTQGLKIER
jgi:hypothetical protein